MLIYESSPMVKNYLNDTNLFQPYLAVTSRFPEGGR